MSNLHSQLEENGFLSDAQHGFRKYQSCETQLYATVHDFYNILEAGGRLDAMILYFSKAFDKVPHEQAPALHHARPHKKMDLSLIDWSRAMGRCRWNRLGLMQCHRWSPPGQCSWTTVNFYFHKRYCSGPELQHLPLCGWRTAIPQHPIQWRPYPDARRHPGILG